MKDKDKKSKETNSSKNIIDKIKEVIEEDIAPMLRQDGGDVEFVNFKDGIVEVKLKGACVGCPMASFTLKSMVEAILIDTIPEVLEIREVKEKN